MAETEVDVIAQIAGEDVPVARLWSHRGRRSESATLSCRSGFLARSDAYPVDSSLGLCLAFSNLGAMGSGPLG